MNNHTVSVSNSEAVIALEELDLIDLDEVRVEELEDRLELALGLDCCCCCCGGGSEPIIMA